MKIIKLVILIGNKVETGVGGDWGGWCVCPDGKGYGVSDNNDHCASLACENGKMDWCNKEKGFWSNRKVKCGAGKKIKACRDIGYDY